MARSWQLRAGLMFVSLIAGCAEIEDVTYLGEGDEVNYYVDSVSRIEYPHIHSELNEEARFSAPPRTLRNIRKDDLKDISLEEAIQTALMNSRIIRNGGAFLSGGNPILSNPNQSPSIYDPAIQETGVLFGGRGVEAALAEFDVQFSTQMTWGREERVLNNSLFAGVPAAVEETGNYVSQLSKTFGNGSSFRVAHNVDYSENNSPSAFVFDNSIFTGSVLGEYRQPLLAGSGTEYTQVAGAVPPGFSGVTGVTQGVVIARINQDITLVNFEQNIIQLVKDVEDAYWDLYLQYRIYDTNVVARNSAERTWRDAKRKLDVGGVRGFSVEDEAQARDQLFRTRANAEQSLSQLYRTELALRRLMGMDVNDGTILRPADEPVTAEFTPDWTVSVAEAITHRPELRRHKWNIKSLDLQLRAAQNLVRPRLDFVANYRVNGFGDSLFDYDDGEQRNSLYGLMTQNNHTGWNLGFEFSMPIGFRSAKAQVQNIELRLAKAREVLHVQELEVSHEVAAAFQELAEAYVTARTNFNRREAAQDRVDLFEKKYEAGTQTLDLVLRAQSSHADADVTYFRSLVAYSKALTNLQFRQGTLLPYNNVHLAESDWEPEAYIDALRRARARTNALDASKYLEAQPVPFVETDPHWDDDTGHVPAQPLMDVPAPDMLKQEEQSGQPMPLPEGTPNDATPAVPPAADDDPVGKPDGGVDGATEKSALRAGNAAFPASLPEPAPHFSPAGQANGANAPTVNDVREQASQDGDGFLPPIRTR